jgi:hypothetical protein
MNRLHVLATLASVPAIALATPGLAGADPTVAVIAGRERIKVTVVGYQFPVDQCRVDPDADRHTQSLPVTASGSMVAHNIAAGSARVMVWCPQGGVIYRGNVDVQPGNPILDLQDQIYAAAGSSDRVTDPTLR